MYNFSLFRYLSLTLTLPLSLFLSFSLSLFLSFSLCCPHVISPASSAPSSTIMYLILLLSPARALLSTYLSIFLSLLSLSRHLLPSYSRILILSCFTLYRRLQYIPYKTYSSSGGVGKGTGKRTYPQVLVTSASQCQSVSVSYSILYTI